MRDAPEKTPPLKACVIGAGASGLTTCKALLARGVPFDCFEKSDDIGGNWYYENPNGVSSAYRLLHIDTSKSRMQFSDFPMPAEYPSFCHHTQVLHYFHAYAQRFGLRDHITFNTAVDRAELDQEGHWQVRLNTGETRTYRALFVCNGHHWDPRWPDPPFPGTFEGDVLHSHHYRSAEPFRGKRVLVLGMGNSAMDLSVELSYTAERVFLAARRGAYILPKYLWGKPIDCWGKSRMPLWMARLVLGTMLRIQVGRMEQYGLPKPDHRLFGAHPSMSSTVLDRIAHGEIVPKPNIAELRRNAVRFVDHSEEAVDAIVYATGYKVSFPFFDPAFLSAPDNDLPLYLRMFRPGMDHLMFIGLAQPLGAIFPIAELQAQLGAALLAGDYALPERAVMEAEIARERHRMHQRYVPSARHTMQVDFDAFVARLKREMRAGKKRAQGRYPRGSRGMPDTSTS